MRKSIVMALLAGLVVSGYAPPAAASHAPTRVALRAPQVTEVDKPIVLRGRVRGAHSRADKVAVLQRQRANGTWRTIKRRDIGTRERFRFVRVHANPGEVRYRVVMRRDNASNRRLSTSRRRTVMVLCRAGDTSCRPPAPGLPPTLPPGDVPPLPEPGEGDRGGQSTELGALGHMLRPGTFTCGGGRLFVQAPTHVPSNGQLTWWLPQIAIWDGAQWLGGPYGQWHYNTYVEANGAAISGWVNYDQRVWSNQYGWQNVAASQYWAVYNWVYVNGRWTAAWSQQEQGSAGGGLYYCVMD